MSVTREKMAAQLRRAIQAVLDRGLHDPRIKGLITVTRVELSPDYANATVHVSVLPEERTELSLHGLVSATAHVRSQVSRRGDFRRVPALHFRRDIVRRREADVLTAIAKATAEDEARSATGAGGQDPSGAASGAGPGASGVSPWSRRETRGDDAGEDPPARASGDADADVLAAFDDFVDAAGDEGSDGGKPATPMDEERPKGPDESTKRGDRLWRRPEDDAT